MISTAVKLSFVLETETFVNYQQFRHPTSIMPLNVIEIYVTTFLNTQCGCATKIYKEIIACHTFHLVSLSPVS